MNSNKINFPLYKNRLRGLERLELSNNKIYDHGSQALFRANYLEKLKYIDLSYNIIVIPIDYTDKSMNSLKTLLLNRNNINSSGC